MQVPYTRKSQENWNKTGKHHDKYPIYIECRVFSHKTNIHNVRGDYVNLLPRMSVARFIEVDKRYKVITLSIPFPHFYRVYLRDL